MDTNDFFQMIEISDHSSATKSELQSAFDSLLDIYSLYLQTKISLIREEVISKAFELHLKDPSFSFIV